MSKASLLLALVGTSPLSTSAQAETVRKLIDTNPGTIGGPLFLTKVGDRVFYQGTDGVSNVGCISMHHSRVGRALPDIGGLDDAPSGDHPPRSLPGNQCARCGMAKRSAAMLRPGTGVP